MKLLMKILAAALTLSLAGNELRAQGTVFTYQGRLNNNNGPVGGNFDLTFQLYDSVANGNVVTAPLTNSPTTVSNGLFTVLLDFGNVFNGNARWLEIGVRTNGFPNAFTLLVPRQPLTPTPYAIFAGNASNAVSTSIANLANALSGPLPQTNFTGSFSNAVNLTSAANSFNGYYSGNGGGLTNVPGGFLVWRIYDSTNLFALANTGYLLTSAQFTTITLPNSTNISDIVRVAAIGSGGWKILARTNQTFFINNLTGAIGASWQPNASSLSWYSIACSSDGTKLLAVNGAAAYASTDSGATWTLRHSGPSWISTASSSDGSHLAAGATGSGQVWTSSDSGVAGSWIARGGVGNWISVASSASGDKLAACFFGGQIFTSTDYGTNWLARDSSRNWYSVASSTDGSKLVAAVTNGFIYTSINSGANWTARLTDSNRGWHGVASSADGTKLAACVYGGQIWTSIDSGANWTARETSRNWSSIAISSDGTKLVATVFNGGVYVSGDSGVTWTTHSPTANWWAVCSSGDGTKLAAAVRTGQIYTSSPSVNVITSGYITGGQGSAIELLSVGNGQFIPISFMGSIFAY